jgi:hypothetical protein
MPVTLTDSCINHRAEQYQKRLQNLDGYILKGHGRDCRVDMRCSASGLHHDPHLARLTPQGRRLSSMGLPAPKAPSRCLTEGACHLTMRGAVV